MSKITDWFDTNLASVADVRELLAQARRLEEAMAVLIDIVKTEKPRLDLSNFTKLLE